MCVNRTLSDTTKESWETASAIINPLPPVEVRAGSDRVPPTLEILRAMT